MRAGAQRAAGEGPAPNQLLRLMQGLKERTQGLVLLTATPMQVHPIEVWDLLTCSACRRNGPPAFLRSSMRRRGRTRRHEEFERWRRCFRPPRRAYGSVTAGEPCSGLPG